MKKLFFILLIFSAPGFSAAQDIVLTSEYNTRNEWVINVQKNAPGTHYLEIYFQEIRNAAPQHQTGTQPYIITMSRSLPAISPAATTAPTVRYSYRYWPGNPESRPDTTFVYRLPFSANVERTVDSLRLLGAGHRAQTYNIGWHAMQFRMQPGDTVYAVRAGEVIRVAEAEADDPPPNPDGRITFKRDVNRVLVEHADGSYAEYSVLEDVVVEPGDHVWPHTPIGRAGSYDGENYQLRFMIYYHRLPPPGVTHEGSRFEVHYVRPLFLTDRGAMKLQVRESYRPTVTTELITREMSRRQARQFEQ